MVCRRIRDHAAINAFFYGWRRRTGIVTLLVAILLMCGWVRSHVVTDQVWKEDNASLEMDLRLGSSGGSIYWIRETVWWKPSGRQDGWNWITEPYHELGKPDGYRYSEQYWIPGAEIAVTVPEQISIGMGQSFANISFWRCCYLWLIFPLTLLSAYLILWKPPKSAYQPTQS